jgi:ketosteroid isomerase-like protein
MSQNSKTSDAVRRELEAAYARAAAAWKAKDAGSLMKVVTPDFTQQMPDGQVIGAFEAESALREWFATTDAITDYQVQVGAVTLQGDEAIADVSEQIKTTFEGPGGGRQERTQANTSRVTWVKTASGWQIRRSEYLTAKLAIDGTPVQPLMTPGAPSVP